MVHDYSAWAHDASEEFGWKFKSKFNIKSLDLGEIIQHESRYVYVINMTLDLIKLVLHDR